MAIKFHQPAAEIYIPDHFPETDALARTTHLAVGAHPDDLEIMAASAILECYQQEHMWFTGVIVTDGRGSPRTGIYEHYSDDEIRLVRYREQRKAATIGEYTALILLDHPSPAARKSGNPPVVGDLVALLQLTRPEVVYTHNLADKHDTHIGVVLNTIAAIRQLPLEERPQKLYGCEAWRSLDWLVESDRIEFDLSSGENLQAALLGVFDSQISGGKRYDLASLARRRANATFSQPHTVDTATGLAYAMDMSALIQKDGLEPIEFIQEQVKRFQQDVIDRLRRAE